MLFDGLADNIAIIFEEASRTEKVCLLCVPKLLLNLLLAYIQFFCLFVKKIVYNVPISFFSC